MPDRVQGTIHFGEPWPMNRHISSEYVFPESRTVESSFNTYSLIRRPGEMIWLVNDDPFFHLTSEAWSGIDPHNESAPFDRPFHLILNLAIGGVYDEGREPGPELLPAVMKVKSIRVDIEG